MNVLVSVILFTANLLALAITLSVLILALAERPGDKIGSGVIQFLAAVSFSNLAAMLNAAVMIFGFGTYLKTITTNLTLTGFALCIVAAFSLVVSLTGMMREAYQLAARAGFVMFLLLQWPLWTGQFFSENADFHLLAHYAPAGQVAASTLLIFILITLAFLWVYRGHLRQSIIVGVVVFLCAHILAIVVPALAEIGVASLACLTATVVLGYRLAKMQLFNPLRMHMSQLAALRDVSQAIAGNHDVQEVLDAVAQQARRAVRTDLALIVIREDSGRMLQVAAQDGGTTTLIGREIVPGTGLSSQIFELHKPMRLQNYHALPDRLPVFADVPVNAILGVPLIYADDVVGVLIICDGR